MLSWGEVIADDGYPLETFTSGDKEKVALFIIAGLGTPAEFFEPLIRELGNSVAVIGCLARDSHATPEPGAEGVAGERHARDIADVLRALGRVPTVLLSYCIGASVAIRACLAFPHLISKAILVSPNYGGGVIAPEVEKTLGFLRLITSRYQDREFFYRFFHEARNESRSDNGVDESEGSLDRMLAADYRKGADHLYHYALNIERLFADDIATQLSQISVPCVTFADELDRLADYRNAIHLSKLSPGCRSVLVDHVGHHGLYSDKSFRRQLKSEIVGIRSGWRSALPWSPSKRGYGVTSYLE